MKRKRSYSRVTQQALSLLGKLIRVGRTERGMTAQELADRAGISRTTLYNIEKGARRPGDRYRLRSRYDRRRAPVPV